MIPYIIKMVFASGILYGYYWLFLRNKQFHQYNRFYLLGLVIVATILPLLKLPVQIFAGHEKTGTAIRLLQVGGMSWEEPVIITGSHGFWKIFFGLKFFSWLIYASVVFILLIFLVRSLIYINRVIHKYPYQQVDDIQFFQTEEPGTPFSFFKRIFWDKKLDVYSDEGNQIFRHELYHVRQGHSYDILFTEIMSILFWFNPFFLLIKKELRAIHEFLADEFAISNSNRYAYAEILLLQSISHKKTHLSNSFFNNQIKRRIAMITKSKTMRNNFLDKVMIAPVLFILLSIFAFRIDDGAKPNFVKSKTKQNISSVSDPRNKSISTTGINLLDTLPKPSAKSQIYTKVEFEADYPGGPNAWVEYLRKNLRYPGKAAGNEIQGEVVVQFIVSKKGDVSDVRAVSGPDELKEEAIKVVRESGKWEPARQGKRKVDCYKKQPIIFRLEQ